MTLRERHPDWDDKREALQLLYEAVEDIALAVTIAIDDGHSTVETSPEKLEALLVALKKAKAAGIEYGE